MNGTLLERIAQLERENHLLRARARWYKQSRDRWRAEARAWKWGALQVHGSPRVVAENLSPTERAEASGVA